MEKEQTVESVATITEKPKIQKKWIRIIPVVLIGLILVIGSFIAGRLSNFFPINFLASDNIEQNKQDVQKDADGTLDCKKQISDLKEEVNAVIENRAILEKEEKIDYSKDQFAIYSPLFENKKVDVWTYKFKGKTIISKTISLENNSSVTVWEYRSKLDPEKGPIDFAIFDGYENYANHATMVEDIKKGWSESYKSVNGINMFYEYGQAPDSIENVSLDSYHATFPNYRVSVPSLVKISVGVNGSGLSRSDSSVLNAKKEATKIADTITFTTLE